MESRRVVVDVAVPPREAFDYLADPANRPAWQSSLRAVTDADPDVGVGQRWVDVTWPGLRPRMETLVHEPPYRWAEEGHWRGVRAYAELCFADAAGGCRIEASVRVEAMGPLGRLLTALAVPAMRSDLRRAARILA